jgi:hypothetical protein
MPNKIYQLVLLLLLSLSSTAQNVLYVSPGAIFKPRNGALVTIKDLNYDNNGASSIAAGDGTVHFSGNSNDTIMGTTATSFDILEVDKPGTGRLFLDRTVTVSTSVNFTAGQLHLNNNRLVLAPTGLLLNEREASKIVGPNGGTVEIGAVPMNAPNGVNPGNLGAVITSSANMGFCLVKRGHVQQTNGSGGGSSIFRYYDISPQINTGLDATLQFTYFDSELNGMDENLLTLWRSVNNTTWVDQGFTSRSTSANYVEKTGIASFSRWTLSTPGNVLPIKFVLFNTQCRDGKVYISWRTGFEQNSSYFEVQRSDNAVDWYSIGRVTAAGNSTTERNYSFTDNSPSAGIAFYRIKEWNINSGSTYTGIMKNDCGQVEDWKVWPNPVHEKLFITVQAAASSIATISMYDSKGALVKVQRQNILAGNNRLTLPVENLSSGSYTIVLNWNSGLSQKTMKIIKQ